MTSSTSSGNFDDIRRPSSFRSNSVRASASRSCSFMPISAAAESPWAMASNRVSRSRLRRRSTGMVFRPRLRAARCAPVVTPACRRIEAARCRSSQSACCRTSSVLTLPAYREAPLTYSHVSYVRRTRTLIISAHGRPRFAPVGFGFCVFWWGFSADDRSALAHWIVVFGYCGIV